MKIIISPAKKMRDDIAYLAAESEPVYLQKSKILLERLRSLSYEQLKEVLACSDALAWESYERYQKMDLGKADTPALLAYVGIQYQYMAPQVFEADYYTYVQKHLRILSGFYGILKPFDAIVPYRLEMQAKLKVGDCRNLYDFWQEDLYREVCDEGVILNLASKEYSRCIQPFISEQDRLVTCVFGELISGQVKEKGVYVKMARGEMVRFLAERQIEDLEEVKQFDRLGFRYDAQRSDAHTFVFLGSPKRAK